MSTVTMLTTLLLIVVLTLILGIAAGYAAVMGLLHAFGHRRPPVRTTTPTLAPMGGSAAGD